MSLLTTLCTAHHINLPRIIKIKYCNNSEPI